MEFNQHNLLKYAITNILKPVLESLESDMSFDQIYNLLSPPPKENMGELAFPCFILSKQLKTSPNQVAQTILEKLSPSAAVKEAKVFGPYLNFFFQDNYLFESILTKVASSELFNSKLTDHPEKTMIEYSQPNTHKEMHVGHMRNLCLGDAMINMFRYAGVETVSTTFPGDVGTHVAKCLWYLKHINTDPIPTERKGAWLGTLYSKSNLYLEEIKGTDKEKSAKEQMTQILKEIEAHQGPYYELWKETRQWSIDLMENIYNWSGTTFDKWYWESDVDSDSVKYVKDLYEQGKLVKDQGAIGMNLEEDKLGFCLLLKSDETGLYATKDVDLARKKFENFNIHKNIYVVDNRQSLHFKQVFKVLDKLGFEDAKNCFHLQYEMVELPDGAMSSRKGNVVPLQELIDDMQTEIVQNHLAKYKNEWSPEKIKSTAKVVAQGAIKYGMTKVDSNKKIVFDKSEWLKLDGDSGPYIQYVHARISSLLQKAGDYNDYNYKYLDEAIEKSLILKIAQFNDVVENCVKQYKTHFLTGYLYELAKSFNSYYAQCNILNLENIQHRNARLQLCDSIAKTLSQGLNLLGITAPDQM